MTTEELQSELAALGCKLWVEGDLLRFRAPDGALTPALMRELKQHKRALIERLSDAPAPRSARPMPVSFAQQALWLIHGMAPESPAYNAATAAWIDSHVDAEALARVWRTLVSRHEPLRTTFDSAGGQLSARVHESPVVDFRVERVDAGSVDDHVRREYARPFDLSRGPLARMRLFTLAPDRHVLLVVVHHIVFDAWSLWVLHEELGELYRKESRGEQGVLPALPARFADFVQWQQEHPNSEAGRKQWEAWRARLAGQPRCAELPWDRPRPRAPKMRGATHHFRLPEGLTERVRELGRAHGATPFMTFLACFQAVVYRLSGADDFVIGATTSGRAKKEFTRMVGYFVNALPLRAELDGLTTFAELLEQTRGRTLEALACQDFPFPLLVERLNPKREAGAPPLCRVMFGLQKPSRATEVMQALGDANEAIDWGGLRARAYPLDQQEGQFDVVLEMMETTGAYLGVLKYDTQLLDAASAERLARRLVAVVRQVTQAPQTPLAELDLIDPQEREELTAVSCAPPVTGAPPRTLAAAFERWAVERPNAVAVSCGDRALSYAEANALANQLSRWLAGRGVGSGDLVAGCLTRGIDPLLVQLACFKLGACWAPLDDAGPRARLARLVGDCRPALVVVDHAVELAAGLREGSLEGAPVVSLTRGWDEVARLPADNVAFEPDPDSLAYVIYTSGTTGAPKGVEVSQRAFCQHLARVQDVYAIRPDDRVLQFSALTFDPSLEQTWSAWNAGAQLVVRGPELWSPSAFWREVQARGVTVANLPPAYFREVTPALATLGGGAAGLRLMLVGGEAFPVECLAAWRGSGVRLLNVYGPTEAVVTATYADLSDFPVDAPRAPIGRPFPGGVALVLDPAGGLTPLGATGELWLAGPALAEGYLGDPTLSESRFRGVTDPRGQTLRAYRTGDLVRWNNRGELEFQGRGDRQVKLRGYRIELGEVETALGALPGVREAVVTLLDSPEPCLCAYYALEPGADQPAEALRVALRAKLPPYMAPERWTRLERLPRKPSGKVDFAALPEPSGEGAGSAAGYAAPSTPVERVLCEVWSEVLGAPRVGIHDDFFELGGASLKSLRIASLAEERGLRLSAEGFSPALLFEHPTVAELARVLTLEPAPTGVAAP